MSLIARIHVSHPELVLIDTIRSLRDVTVRLEYRTEQEGGGPPLYFVRTSTDSSEAFERALRTDATVGEWRSVARVGDHRVYSVTARTDVELVPNRCTALGARILEVTSAEEGWCVRLHLLTRDALAAFREYCTDHDVTYTIRELTNANSLQDDHSFGLTEEQRTILLLAYDAGYYEVPRQASQDDLATELDVSTSAVSQRLRRATALLIANTVAVQDR